MLFYDELTNVDVFHLDQANPYPVSNSPIFTEDKCLSTAYGAVQNNAGLDWFIVIQESDWFDTFLFQSKTTQSKFRTVFDYVCLFVCTG
jgi:hypothetical protein